MDTVVSITALNRENETYRVSGNCTEKLMFKYREMKNESLYCKHGDTLLFEYIPVYKLQDKIVFNISIKLNR